MALMRYTTHNSVVVMILAPHGRVRAVQRSPMPLRSYMTCYANYMHMGPYTNFIGFQINSRARCRTQSVRSGILQEREQLWER